MPVNLKEAIGATGCFFGLALGCIASWTPSMSMHQCRFQCQCDEWPVKCMSTSTWEGQPMEIPSTRAPRFGNLISLVDLVLMAFTRWKTWNCSPKHKAVYLDVLLQEYHCHNPWINDDHSRTKMRFLLVIIGKLLHFPHHWHIFI